MLRIGHRGARAYAPENTLASFKRALEMGANVVEFDLRKTSDGYIVVIHDEDVKRTTNGEGAVARLALEQIKALSAGDDQKIPTLEEALDFLDKKVKMIIELKEPGFEETVLATVHKRGLEKNVIVASFHEEALKCVREIDSNIETGLIYSKHSNPIKAAFQLKANYLLAFYRFVHTANVQKAHANGLKVIVWNINTPQEAQQYALKGVDGIATDKLDIFTQVSA